MRPWPTGVGGRAITTGFDGMARLTVPTWFTLARFAAALAIPAMYLLFDRPAADIAALTVFAAGALTDFADGQLARRLRLESRLGAALDPVADKALVLVALAVLLGYLEQREWLLLPVAVIFVREFLIAGLREYLGPADMSLKVTWTAKWKAAAQMIAIVVLFASGAAATESNVVATAGLVLIWLAAVLTAVSGINYLQKALRQIDGGKAQ